MASQTASEGELQTNEGLTATRIQNTPNAEDRSDRAPVLFRQTAILPGFPKLLLGRHSDSH